MEEEHRGRKTGFEKRGVGGARGGFRPAHVDLHRQAYVRSLDGVLDANEKR